MRISCPKLKLPMDWSSCLDRNSPHSQLASERWPRRMWRVSSVLRLHTWIHNLSQSEQGTSSTEKHQTPRRPPQTLPYPSIHRSMYYQWCESTTSTVTKSSMIRSKKRYCFMTLLWDSCVLYFVNHPAKRTQIVCGGRLSAFGAGMQVRPLGILIDE